MDHYETIRRRWSRELERAGEARRLRREARSMLERGSLAVLCTTLLERLDRRLATARRLATVALWGLWAGLAACALLQLATIARPGLLDVDPLLLPAAAASHVATCVALLALGHVAAVRTARRRRLYERLEPTVHPLTRLLEA